MSRAGTSALHRALSASQELVAAAEAGNADAAASFDLERMKLLKEARRALQPVDAEDRELVRQIALLNERAIGFLQHALRRTVRDLDMLSVGRRAVRAYSATRSRL